MAGARLISQVVFLCGVPHHKVNRSWLCHPKQGRKHFFFCLCACLRKRCCDKSVFVCASDVGVDGGISVENIFRKDCVMIRFLYVIVALAMVVCASSVVKGEVDESSLPAEESLKKADAVMRELLKKADVVGQQQFASLSKEERAGYQKALMVTATEIFLLRPWDVEVAVFFGRVFLTSQKPLKSDAAGNDGEYEDLGLVCIDAGDGHANVQGVEGAGGSSGSDSEESASAVRLKQLAHALLAHPHHHGLSFYPFWSGYPMSVAVESVSVTGKLLCNLAK